MARVPFLTREDMAPEHRFAWDEIAGSRGEVLPNFRALLNGPMASSKLANLGAYVRFDCALDAKIRRLAALATAREADGDYVWTVNVPQAGPDGVAEETVRAIHDRSSLKELSPDDSAIVGFVRELLRTHRVSESTFDSVQDIVGTAGVVDLLVLVGYYWMLSHALSGLEVEPPGGVSTL